MRCGAGRIKVAVEWEQVLLPMRKVCYDELKSDIIEMLVAEEQACEVACVARPSLMSVFN